MTPLAYWTKKKPLHTKLAIITTKQLILKKPKKMSLMTPYMSFVLMPEKKSQEKIQFMML